MIGPPAVAVAGLVEPRLLTAGIGLAWTALLFAAAIRVVLLRPSSEVSSSRPT